MSEFSTAPTPSFVALPDCDPPYPTILDFLDARFPKLGREVWRARLEQGKITDDFKHIIDLNSPYQPGLRLRYFREVEEEPEIPFQETIIFQNDRILVADKPHFLPVTPSGPYVNQCLLYRLRAATGIQELVALHRIDRETAGLVMFSADKNRRGIYHDLFSLGRARKSYEAIATLPKDTEQEEWLLQSRIEPGEPWFRVKDAEGPVNAISKIRLLERKGQLGRFRLEPLTGKQHQLRLHLSLLGVQILHDRYYPELQPKQPDDFTKPLQLLAKELCFLDPVNKEMMNFQSTKTLTLP
ncbi:MAG: pseudouridine synthase [bacterium]|nr:pseudouridine synthase [bacterium]